MNRKEFIFSFKPTTEEEFELNKQKIDTDMATHIVSLVLTSVSIHIKNISPYLPMIASFLRTPP